MSKKNKGKKVYHLYRSGSIIHSRIYTVYSSKPKKRTRKDKRTCKHYDNGRCKHSRCHVTYCTTASGCTLYKRVQNKKKEPKTIPDNKLRYQDEYLDYPGQSGIHVYTPVWDVGLSRNIGTPSHTTFVKAKDSRRNKRRCLYYSKDTKYCQYYTVVCRGSTRCAKYQEKEKQS